MVFESIIYKKGFTISFLKKEKARGKVTGEKEITSATANFFSSLPPETQPEH